MSLPSFLFKLFLILLLPCIAIAIYIEGQNYDSALISFKAGEDNISSIAQSLKSTTTTPSSVHNIDFDTVDSYKLMAKQREFTKANLYEHVNGHAEYFISMGFVSLAVYEYNRSGTLPDIQVEVFDMGNSLQAFGTLMDAVGQQQQSIDVGTFGFETQSAVSFIKGNFYVRVIPYKKGVSVTGFAKSFASRLPASKDSLNAFSRLPKIGKVISTRFIKEGYRGMDFMNNVIERQYNVQGKTVYVAMLVFQKQQPYKVMSEALRFAQGSGAEIQQSERPNIKIIKVVDKYEGNWALIQSKDFVFGLFGELDEEIINNVASVK